MKMLVTKFSDGKYRNEGELFAEPISDDNVKLMGEMIALQVLRNANSFDYEVVEKLYNGLVKDMHHMNEKGYIISDGYDYAQIAICFLLQFRGRYAADNYGVDSRGKTITIKKACYREVDKVLLHYRRKIARNRQIEFTHNKHDIPDPKDCFENKEIDYDKADKLIKDLQLNDAELATLNCYLSGMNQSQAALALGMTIFAIKYKRIRIRQKYAMYIGDYR